MSEKEIIDSLISRDETVTRQFFFLRCRSLFCSIINHVFSYDVDYDEFVNEFYLYLMENDAYRLRQFQGRSSIYQWMKVIAIRYFIAKRDKMIEDDSKENLLEHVEEDRIHDESDAIAKMDVQRLLSFIPNKRYVYVIRRLVLQDAEPEAVADELSTNVDNLYNIKRRAIASLTNVALKETEKYEK